MKNGHSQNDRKLVIKTNYRLMQVKIFVKLPFVIKIFVMSIFEWPFYTGFTVNKMFAFLDLCISKSTYLTVTMASISDCS